VYGVSGGPGVLRIGNAMVRRTALGFLSYRLQLVSVLLYLTVTCVLFYAVGGAFLAAMFGPVASLGAGALASDLVLFLLLGFAAWPVFWKSWEVTAMSVRREQWEGTFESIVPLPNGVRALPFSYLYANLGYTLFYQAVILVILATALPGQALRLADPTLLLNFAAVVLLSVLCMWGMGLLFGGLAILYQQVGPIDSVIRPLFLVLAGVFVPIAVLPGWLQLLATALPLTYAFELLRGIAIEGATLADLTRPLIVLASFTLTFILAGNVLYKIYVDRARHQGAIQGY
jgi:ABC-2 type transport system permease protein